MKIIILLITTLLSSIQVYADCDYMGLWAYPQNDTINQNSNIILIGYFASQDIINSLNDEFPIYLKSEDHEVKLNVKNTYTGLFELTQAILEPMENLIQGNEYVLKIDNLNEDQKPELTKWNSILRKSEPISWIVDNFIDNEKPELLSTPKLVDKHTIYYGCGPSVFADFKINASETSSLFVKTELVNLKSEISTTYILPVDDNGIVSVGHDMCSGAFVFEEKVKYKVRFKMMDISGNESLEWTSWVKFGSPFKSYKDKSG